MFVVSGAWDRGRKMQASLYESRQRRLAPLHMDNTVQMHKHVGGGRGFRRIRISHQAHRQVLYFSDAGEGGGGGEEGKVVDGQ